MPDSWDFEKKRPEATDRGDHPPILTWATVGLCILFTVANQTMEGARGTFWETLGRFGHLSGEEIWSGHYWALLTSVFVHGDPHNFTMTLMHLGFNMLWLLQLGALLEGTISPLAWVAFFIGATLVGSGAQLALSGSTGVGASGVVYAMFGLMWVGRGKYPAWRTVATRQNLNMFVVWGIGCFIATHLGFMRIANAAHGGGFLFGLAAGYLFCSLPGRATAPMKAASAAALAVLIGLTICSVTWMPWNGEWNFWKGNREFTRHRYQAAIGWYRRCIRLGFEPELAWDNISRAATNLGDKAEAEEAVREMNRANGQADEPAPPTKPTAPDQER